MNEYPPELPDVDPTTLELIARHADQMVAWLERHQAEAARIGGHDPASQELQISGWRFVADALREATM